jgi:hypothetical protein
MVFGGTKGAFENRQLRSWNWPFRRIQKAFLCHTLRSNVYIRHDWMILKTDRIARRKGLPLQAQIKEWLAQ